MDYDYLIRIVIKYDNVYISDIDKLLNMFIKPESDESNNGEISKILDISNNKVKIIFDIDNSSNVIETKHNGIIYIYNISNNKSINNCIEFIHLNKFYNSIYILGDYYSIKYGHNYKNLKKINIKQYRLNRNSNNLIYYTFYDILRDIFYKSKYLKLNTIQPSKIK